MRPRTTPERPKGSSVSTTATTALRKTALNPVHRTLGAKMVDFGGWDMPVEYPAGFNGKPGGLINEHMAVRTGGGLLDFSHMGEFQLRGPGSLASVQLISMKEASKWRMNLRNKSEHLYPQ